MAADIVLLDTAPPALPGPAFPGINASPAEHLAWCESFGLYCSRQARRAGDFDLPTRKWLQAAELAAYAAAAWRERV